MTVIKALSVKQPWSHAIVHLGKDLENRPRSHSYRGLLLIHASAGMPVDYYAEADAFIHRACAATGVRNTTPSISALQRGGIVGICEMVDTVSESDSPWWMGPRAFVLRNARPLPFIACAGTVAPLIWTPTDEVLSHVRSAL